MASRSFLFSFSESSSHYRAQSLPWLTADGTSPLGMKVVYPKERAFGICINHLAAIEPVDSVQEPTCPDFCLLKGHHNR